MPRYFTIVALVIAGCVGSLPEMKSAGNRDQNESDPAKPNNTVPPPPPATVAKTPRDGFTFLAEYWLASPARRDVVVTWYPTAPTAAFMFVIDGPATDISNIVVETKRDGLKEWRPLKQFPLGPASPSFVLELPVAAMVDRLTFRFTDPKTTTRVLVFIRDGG
jgi:hypothetical protein